MIIASGKRNNPVAAIQNGERCTFFKAQAIKGGARKTWIAGQLKTAGSITVDKGAAKALQREKSLLPAGVTKIKGPFLRGDTVTILGPDGNVLGQGLIAYDSIEADLIKGKQSAHLEDILGYSGRHALIHIDDMALITSHATLDADTKG